MRRAWLRSGRAGNAYLGQGCACAGGRSLFPCLYQDFRITRVTALLRPAIKPKPWMKRRLSFRSACVVLALAAVLAPSAHGKKEKEPDQVDRKIRLMGEALLARDAGDFALARQRLEQLLSLFPQDQQIQRLLQAITTQAAEAEAARQRQALKAAEAAANVPAQPESSPEAAAESSVSAQATTVPAATHAPEASLVDNYTSSLSGPADVETLVRLETQRQQQAMEEAGKRLNHAQQLANEGRHEEALRELQDLDVRLPVNPMTLALHQRHDSLRIDLEHRVTVAALSPGIEPPRLSLTQESAADKAPQLEVELELVELPVELVDDLWTAWVFFSEDTLSRGTERLVFDRQGRPAYNRPLSRIPTQRQQLLISAFREAHARPSSGAPFQIREGVAGMIAALDPRPIMLALSRMEGSRVLGSPRFKAAAGQKTNLTFTPEVEARGSLMEGPSRIPETRMGWQIQVTPQLLQQGTAVAFDLKPRVNRYEGFVVSSDNPPSVENAGLAAKSVYSTHELQARVEVPLESTLMLAGLTWDEGAPHRLKPGVLRQLPFVGHYVRLRETAGRQTELLVFVSARRN